jgi:mycothiol synthase
MISYAWRDRFAPAEAAELAEMLAQTAADDDEAGFSRLTLDEGDRRARHLLVWLQPDDRLGAEQPGDPRLAAYLRLDPEPDAGPDGGGAAMASYVVRPEFRSRGVTTLLVESLGLELGSADGWAGTGLGVLRIWARGDHPAALRLSERFGVWPARREWQLLAPLRAGGLEPATRPPVPGFDDAAVAELWGAGDPPDKAEALVVGDQGDVAGAVWFDPGAGEKTEYGLAGRIEAVRVRPGSEPSTTRALLIGAMAGLRAGGVRVAAITVGSTEAQLVHEVRTLGFQHDQTDVQYVFEARPQWSVAQ